MKIVHALGWYYPESLGGTEVYVAGLCRRLLSIGHDVAVVAPLAGREGTAEYQHEHVNVFRYPVPASPTRDEAQGLVIARGAELFHTWLARNRPDVLHLHSMVTGLGLHEIRVAHDLGIPVVLTHHLPSLGVVCRQGALMEHGATPCDGLVAVERCAACVLTVRGLPTPLAAGLARVPQAVSRMLGRIPGPLGTAVGMPASIDSDRSRFRALNELVDAQVALNETGCRILIANGAPPHRVVLNRLGIDHVPTRKPGPDEAPTMSPVRFGYVGRIDAAKGIRQLILAVRMLPSALPLTLEIVGPMQASVPREFGGEILREAQGDPRISFTPPVPSRDVPTTLGRFDVLCCPSTGFENGPTVALEAMAVGVPVVATRIGNLAEIVRDGIDGRLVPAGDLHALSSVLGEIAASPNSTVDRWRRLLEPVRTLNHVVSDYLSLYTRLRPTAARAS